MQNKRAIKIMTVNVLTLISTDSNNCLRNQSCCTIEEKEKHGFRKKENMQHDSDDHADYEQNKPFKLENWNAP